MGNQILTDEEISNSNEIVGNNVSGKTTKIEKGSRTIGAGLRLKILDRDNFRCVLCGRSPATEIGVRLHIDHKVPFSQGGQSTIDNLQTLCQTVTGGRAILC
jgi:5-methylcytosine-specific restriction endonuclease McrA